MSSTARVVNLLSERLSDAVAQTECYDVVNVDGKYMTPRREAGSTPGLNYGYVFIAGLSMLR
eukprot:3975178-Pyramimonas_sp.AAC.1